jgi:hypothetical protein
MRKFVLAAMALVCTFGLVIAGEVTFVKFDKEKKEVTVKDGDKETTYKITDKTTFKRVGKDGDKDVPADAAMKMMEKMPEGKAKFELTAEKDEVKEIKMKGRMKDKQ